MEKNEIKIFDRYDIEDFFNFSRGADSFLKCYNKWAEQYEIVYYDDFTGSLKMQKITKIVCEEFNVPIENILTSRKESHILVKQCVTYICKKIYDIPDSSLKGFFKYTKSRQSAIITYNIRAFNKELETNEEINSKFNNILNRLK